MSQDPSSTISISWRRPSSAGDGASEPTVVTLGGEHDICTVTALTGALDRAMRRDGGGLVIDLRDVEFMGAATLGVIVHAREVLRANGRLLVLRSPSVCAMRVIELCGLGELLEDPHEAPDGADPGPGVT